jgi:site-specific recombinase XerD
VSVKPSTVCRRLSVVVGFYRTCVIDGLLEHSPADYVRRPSVPPESPTFGLSHLQFEALLIAARLSDRPCDFALVAMLAAAGFADLRGVRCRHRRPRRGNGHRVLRVVGKGHKVVLVPLPPAVGRA